MCSHHQATPISLVFLALSESAFVDSRHNWSDHIDLPRIRRIQLLYQGIFLLWCKVNLRLYGSVLKNHRVFLLWWNVGDTAFSYIILLPISYIKSDKISRPSQKFYQVLSFTITYSRFEAQKSRPALFFEHAGIHFHAHF